MTFSDDPFLERTVQEAPIGICILNAATLISEIVNDKFLEIAGKPRETILDQFYWDAFAEARIYYEAALNGVVEKGEAYHADEVELMLIRHGKEEMVFVTFVYVPIKNKEGEVSKVAIWVLENTKQVTRRQQIEVETKAFQRERDRLKSFFMQAPAGICILDGPEFKFELVNPAYQQLLPGRELQGRFIFDALPELIGTPLQEVLLNVYRTGQPYDIQEALIPLAEYEGGPTKDRYFTFNYIARRNAHEEVNGILAFVFEVTGIITVQNQLREARERSDQQKRIYETIISGTPDLMYVWDLNYRFTYVNSALLTMWGKTWENAVGRSLLENGYEPWHAEMHEREIDQVRATKQSVRGEVSFPHATLGKRIYDYILVPVLNDQGEVEAVAGTTRDVTERKLFEEALAQSSEELQAINEEMVATNEEMAASNEELTVTNEELAEANKNIERLYETLAGSERQLKTANDDLLFTIDAAALATFDFSPLTGRLSGNELLKSWFGLQSKEEIPLAMATDVIAEGDRGSVIAAIKKALDYRSGGKYDVEYTILNPNDPEPRVVHAKGKASFNEAKEATRLSGTIQDITEQKKDDQRKNDFIGMVSHELKTPLTSLTAIVQVLNAKLKNSDDAFVVGALDKANVQVKKMSNMINGFLNVSRLESGKMQIVKQGFSLDELIRETIREQALTVTTHIIELNLCDHIQINADRDKISSVIANLISNAVKYSPKGREIKVECRMSEDHVQVSVKDEGMGIKAADLPYVFDRYFRVETNHTQHISGFGIGLYLSAEIIRQHNGKIWADSESGVGSTFYFSLPL